MKRQRGMTILEVLISIVVAMLVLAGVVISIQTASSIARHNIYKTGAVNRAQERIEEIKSALSGSFAGIAGYDGLTDTVVIYTGSTTDTNDDINAARAVNIIWRDGTGAEVVGPGTANFAEVQVNVNWDVLPAAYQETVTVVTNMAVHT